MMAEEEVVLVGRVVGEGGSPVLAKATLETGGVRSGHHHEARFVLEVGRRTVVVELAPALLVEEREEGRWTEVAETRLGRLFADQAPGDHVKVEISGVVLVSGDVLAVRGRALEVAPAAGAAGSYRDAPDAVVTSVHALRAARGADEAGALAALERIEAEARSREAREAREAQEARRKVQEQREREERKKAEAAARPPRVPPPWQAATSVFALLTVAGVAGTAWASAPLGWSGLIPHAPGATLLWVMSLIALGATAICWEVRHDLPLVHEVGVGWPVRARGKWAMPFQLVLVAIVLPMSIGGGTSKAEAIPRVATLIAVVIPAVYVVLTLRRRWSAVRRLWLVARARPLPAGSPGGAWGYVDGIVHAGGRVLGARTTLTWQSEVKEEEIKTHLEPAHGFELQMPTGAAHVDVTGAVWAAPAVWRRDSHKPVAVAAISGGDLVRVLGRLREVANGPCFQSTGRESLFIVAGSPWRLWLRVVGPTLVHAAIVVVAVLIVVV